MHFCCRYNEIAQAGKSIHDLLNQNRQLLLGDENEEIDKKNASWIDYVGYIDEIVADALLKTVGCR